MKNWLRAQPRQPDTLADLQALPGTFAGLYNTHRPQGRLVDVGCGPGRAPLPLASLFEAVVGLDPDPEMLACVPRAGQGLLADVAMSRLERDLRSRHRHPCAAT
jgi:SAM-dependent methyltransferase